ncbi:hypothetical protein [Nannocystis pusilla]|uniref:Uncharacterized protein n=1 Tax=Nannocystis pusilla TaxID=889268 RepID=A0ABS7TPL5_9BACT|nr:hypothetical protein [Nannocystis pusilla]MBZ5710166.1 hypothetical protein [Nannocystis pusilla]
MQDASPPRSSPHRRRRAPSWPPRLAFTAALAASGAGLAREPETTARAGDALAECYERTVVPPLGLVDESGQRLRGLNEHGVVLLDALPHRGPAWYAGETGQTAFVWADGEARPIEIDGLVQTLAVDINDRDEVLVFGTSEVGVLPRWTEAALWQDGALAARFSSPSGVPFAHGELNERGHLVLATRAVTTLAAEAPGRVYRWRGDDLEDLGEGRVLAFGDDDTVFGVDYVPAELHGTEVMEERLVQWGAEKTVLPTTCEPYGIGPVELSPHGRAVVTYDCDVGRRSDVWVDGEARMLPVLMRDVTEALDLNDSGDIIGLAMTKHLEMVPVLWRGEAIRRLPTPPSAHDGRYTDINRHGLMVGVFDQLADDKDVDLPLFYVSNGRAVAELPYPSPTMGYGEASALMNDRGDIVGSTDNLGSDHRTMLWRACEL